MELSAGTRLGPYEILAPLGAGEMGEVYRATDTKLGRDVAIHTFLTGWRRQGSIHDAEGQFSGRKGPFMCLRDPLMARAPVVTGTPGTRS